MKKSLTVMLVIFLCISFFGCTSKPLVQTNYTYNPNEGKIKLTYELKEEIKDYLKDTSWSGAEQMFSRGCESRTATIDSSGYHENEKVDSIRVDIVSYEQKDDYHYVVYVRCIIWDHFGDTTELKTSILVYFEENTESKERKIQADYSQFQTDFRKLNL